VNDKKQFPFIIKDIHEAILKKPQVKMSASPKAMARKNSLPKNELNLQRQTSEVKI
jgi:hypothetical protein